MKRRREESSYLTAAAAAKSRQACPTLCDPTDGSPPGSPVPGILQARTLEWVAISFSCLADAVKSQLFAFSTCQCVNLVLSRALSWVLQGFLSGFLRPQLIFQGRSSLSSLKFYIGFLDSRKTAFFLFNFY